MNYDGHDSREGQKTACSVRIPRTKCSTQLIYVFGGCGFGVGLAFCHWRFVPGSAQCHAVFFIKICPRVASSQPVKAWLQIFLQDFIDSGAKNVPTALPLESVYLHRNRLQTSIVTVTFNVFQVL